MASSTSQAPSSSRSNAYRRLLRSAADTSFAPSLGVLFGPTTEKVSVSPWFTAVAAVTAVAPEASGALLKRIAIGATFVTVKLPLRVVVAPSVSDTVTVAT